MLKEVVDYLFLRGQESLKATLQPLPNYSKALEHPIAQAGYQCDMDALRACDACVLVLPSGRSASWEFGFALGQGKKGAVVMFEACEPELMYLGNPILTSPDELFDWAGEPKI